MMIVVEGPDGSGKTSLIERLQATYPDLELRPRAVGSDTNYKTDLDTWVVEELGDYDTGDEDFIYDRHQLISHLIYGPIMRRTLFGEFQNLDWLYLQLRSFWQRNPIVIVCLPPVEAVVQNMAEDSYKVADIEYYYWLYHAWLGMNLTFPHTHRERAIIHWDYTDPNKGDFEQLVDTINRLERAL